MGADCSVVLRETGALPAADLHQSSCPFSLPPAQVPALPGAAAAGGGARSLPRDAQRLVPQLLPRHLPALGCVPEPLTLYRQYLREVWLAVLCCLARRPPPQTSAPQAEWQGCCSLPLRPSTAGMLAQGAFDYDRDVDLLRKEVLGALAGAGLQPTGRHGEPAGVLGAGWGLGVGRCAGARACGRLLLLAWCGPAGS